MDFSYIEEQQLLADSVNRLIEKEYDFEKRKKYLAASEGFSRDMWNSFAELGLLGLSVPAEYGGFGATTVDVMIVMEAMGRGLVVEPYFPTAIMGSNLIALGAPEAMKQVLLPQIVEGKLLVAVAYTERQSRYELANVELSAKPAGGGYVLNGSKSVVLHGGSADKIIVSARTAGAARDAAGITLFILDRKAAGVSVRDYPTIDGMHAAEIAFKDVKVAADAVIGEAGNGLPLLQRVADIGLAALCAEAVGAMQSLNTATLEYLKTRQQFGVPIGKFQALQHRMVDMVMQAEFAKSMACLASVKCLSENVAERRRACSGAKAFIGQAGRFVGQQAIQLHGGMGMTNELNVGHYFKRLTMIDATLGDADFHLAKVGDGILAASVK
jgi:alkylation response protein AidB-like acyl-CoA dehydrogenase